MKIWQTEAALPQHTFCEADMRLTTFIPVRFKKRGARTVIVPPPHGKNGENVQSESTILPSCDTVLLIALGRAFHWQRLLDEGLAVSGSEIARREALHPSTVNDLLRLSLLAPDIVEVLIAGRQPRTMTLLWFQQHPLPIAWDRQREIVTRFGGDGNDCNNE